MSSTSSNADNSQNDSDTNFIPGYVMEVEDEGLNMSSSVAIRNEDEWFVKPYEDEPIADENWMATYNEQRRQEEDTLQLLKTRLDGQDNVDNWCKCGNCCIELLQNPKECQCCMEVEACFEALNSDQVIHEVASAPSCVTLHPGFKPVCLEIWSLRLAGRKYRKIDKKKYEMKDTENRYLRSISYREYIQLIYGYLGRRRIPLPACAYDAIRRKFREQDFMGYEDDE